MQEDGHTSALSYAQLTPDAVLDALDSVGLRGDGRLLQLNSYENRVLQVHLEDGRIAVAKFYRPGRWSDEQILEEHGYALELAAAEVPAVAPWPLELDAHASMQPELLGGPPTLARLGALRWSVSPRCGGRAPELEDEEVLAWVGRYIGRLHAVGKRRPFRHRVHWSGADPAQAAFDWLMANDALPLDAAPAWSRMAEQAIAGVRERFAAVPGLRELRLHGDMHIGNLLWTPAGPHFVDLDDACIGPAVQDLWMLLPGERKVSGRAIGCLLEGYTSFCDFDERELELIEALRTVRLIHYSAWLSKRWGDPAFPAAFPWFGSSAYWAEQTTRLRDQIELMDSPL
ncbi:MAG TPA: serine/threonine protein kinase [Methylibium sp.]